MTSKVKSLIWLRWQFLMSNKFLLFLAISPIIYLSLLTIVGNSETNVLYMGTGVSSIYSLTAGSFLAMMISEEKEKKNLKTLILSGVKEGDYIISAILFPVLFAVLEVVLLPFIFQIKSMDWLTFLPVVCLTVVFFVLINLLIVFLTKSQTQATLFSISLYFLATFLPILADQSRLVKVILDWSFYGATTRYFSKVGAYSLTDTSFYALIVWVILVGIVTVFAYRRNRYLV
ncbi:ABC transporter permease [Streptococcus saliviloxodontae]|uniref:ABC-2 type transport system permease protein n=1 Tax=Streptococcus saliviloxodontae TaxID=1349416 RepID=A0ABS2PMP4_9STRE|nr:ABC transporter permease [Streptococcus saliviloxodontae]MBM7636713.1 ABC-2 type transport system permease protein [Streptococcus saliviloxodontae]